MKALGLIAAVCVLLVVAGGVASVGRADTACSAGYWSDTGNEPCVETGPGTYAPCCGATSLTPCPGGTYESNYGAAGPCDPAPPGKFVPDPPPNAVAGAVFPTLCPVATYQPNSGQTSCLPCPQGTTTDGPGSTGCVTHCKAGAYSATGDEPCTQAPIGTYVSTEAATEPTPCPPGTSTPATGATSADDCTGNAAESNVLTNVTAAISNYTDKLDSAALRQAASALTASLVSSLWPDGNHLTPKKGAAVFKDAGKAVATLAKLLASNRSSVPAATLQAWITSLVAVDRTLAATAIQDAIANNVAPKKIAAANAAVARGDASNGSRAIGDYGTAWSDVS
jgi:hypothetical protein